ncbi:MAG: hypothetical protein H0U10_14795 [Chloroflexia bacterium]|nr:hypothetical protein [Chloroflexia bacterium]
MAKTCQELGVSCGPAGDGCGGTLACGECDDGAACETAACDEGGACIYTPNDAACSTNLACKVAGCRPGEPGADPDTGCVVENAAANTGCPGGGCCNGSCNNQIGAPCGSGGTLTCSGGIVVCVG